MKYPIILLTLLAALACNPERDAPPSSSVPDSSTTPRTTLPTAKDISYDNAGSRLADRNVQGALDELAGRIAAQPDAIGRIEIIEATQAAAGGVTGYEVAANCPKRSEGFGRALGGSCSDDSKEDGISVRSTDLGPHGFSCLWNKPDPLAAKFTAKVTCFYSVSTGD